MILHCHFEDVVAQILNNNIKQSFEMTMDTFNSFKFGSLSI